jgi:uncharacterized CHY-type Zn-finger protein
MELLQANLATGNTSPRNKQQTGHKVSQPFRCTLTTQLQCSSCKGPHALFHCDEFLKLQPQQRFEHAKQVKACINCLQVLSKNHRCTRGTCRKCGERHNTFLHATNKGSTNDNNSAHGKGNSVADVNTYCLFNP